MKQLALFILIAFTPSTLFAEEDPRGAIRKELNETLDLYYKALETPDDKVVKIVDEESKALGFEKFPFSESLKKILGQHTDQAQQKLRSTVTPIYVAYLMQRFSDAELNDIILFMKNPLAQRQTRLLYSWGLGSGLDVLKDQKLFDLYQANGHQFIAIIERLFETKRFDDLMNTALEEATLAANAYLEKKDAIDQKLQERYGHLITFALGFAGTMENLMQAK